MKSVALGVGNINDLASPGTPSYVSTKLLPPHSTAFAELLPNKDLGMGNGQKSGG